MSTELVLARDPALLPPALRGSISGVTFFAYLAVEAAQLDHIEPERVLAWLSIGAADFDKAGEVFSERVAEALSDIEGFDAVYEDLLGQFVELWSRPVEPLSSDAVAWIAYQRHALASAEPEQLAAKLGLTPGDELRLARRWRQRLTDPAVAAAALQAMDGPLPALPELTLPELSFPPGVSAS
ncbi:MAG: hypothetical protein U0271_22460 [Polyangiaceae bacterium]